jgi:flagellar biosynthesis/type III secretory pathway protein FliH
MGEVKAMGDYVSVKCEKCRKEVTAEFIESLEESIEAWIPLCEECFEGGHCPDCTTGYDEGYEAGYDEGLEKGDDTGYDRGYNEGYYDAEDKAKEKAE